MGKERNRNQESKNRILNLNKNSLLNLKDGEIIEFLDETVKIKCLICGTLHEITYQTLAKGISNSNYTIHGVDGCSCSRIINKEGEKLLGKKEYNKFKNHYRYAHERCFNKNCKDYQVYKGRFNLRDFPEYYYAYIKDYKDAIDKYGLECLSIDRIDNDGKYEVGNIRFVPIKINLENMDNNLPVLLVDSVNLTVEKFNSLNELAKIKFNITKLSAICESARLKRIYLNRYWILYSLETQSTIESIDIEKNDIE